MRTAPALAAAALLAPPRTAIRPPPRGLPAATAAATAATAAAAAAAPALLLLLLKPNPIGATRAAANAAADAAAPVVRAAAAARAAAAGHLLATGESAGSDSAGLPMAPNGPTVGGGFHSLDAAARAAWRSLLARLPALWPVAYALAARPSLYEATRAELWAAGGWDAADESAGAAPSAGAALTLLRILARAIGLVEPSQAHAAHGAARLRHLRFRLSLCRTAGALDAVEAEVAALLRDGAPCAAAVEGEGGATDGARMAPLVAASARQKRKRGVARGSRGDGRGGGMDDDANGVTRRTTRRRWRPDRWRTTRKLAGGAAGR